jgi:aldose 1-epimerase
VEVVRLGGESIEVEVLPELGARLHRLRAFGHDLLRTPDDPATHARDPFFWGAYVMAPWCNRIDAGRITAAGRVVDLAANFVDGSAIHGQVYARAWESRGDGVFRVAAGGDGWPWPYEVTQRIDVEADALTVELVLVNRSDAPMPAGIGLHPWFRAPVEVAIHAASVYPSNTRSRASSVPVDGIHDLRGRAAMAPGVDATWTDVEEPPVQLAWPDARIGATLRTEGTASHVTAASRVDLGAVAVEPQTHAPQGLRRLLSGEPGALSQLEPGASLRLVIALEMTSTRPPGGGC